MTPNGDDISLPWETFRLSAATRHAPATLRRRHSAGGTGVRHVVQRMLGDLRAARQLKPFRIWLVGSRVQPGYQLSDVDLVLSPRIGCAPSEQLVVDALWFCREYGLHGTDVACSVDPCFRTEGPTRDVAALPPNASITTVKFMSPRLIRLVANGGIRLWRPLVTSACSLCNGPPTAVTTRNCPSPTSPARGVDTCVRRSKYKAVQLVPPSSR